MVVCQVTPTAQQNDGGAVQADFVQPGSHAIKKGRAAGTKKNLCLSEPVLLRAPASTVSNGI
jgi:hypothetical protein